MERYFLFFLLYTSHLIAGVSLFPEDGSQTITRWYYSPHEISYMYETAEWQSVLEKFKENGITPINSDIGNFFQDLAFFSTDGKLVLQHFPKYDSRLTLNYERYFSGFTMEIFTPPDWGTDYEVNLLTINNTKHLGIKTHQLESTFIEGGASVSGRFSNGDDYLLVNHSSFLGMQAYYLDLSKGQMTESEIISKVEKDFNLKPGNFIYLKGTSHYHLDTFLKALPGGKILIDHPDGKVAMLEQLRKYTGNKAIDSYIKYEKQYRNTFYHSVIKRAKEQLEKRFDVVTIPGAFTRFNTYNTGVSSPLMDINFFNGVSGLYKNEQFYITNKAELVPELERFWKMQMRNYGINKVYFPGVYKGKAGLDCMGSPAP